MGMMVAVPRCRATLAVALVALVAGTGVPVVGQSSSPVTLGALLPRGYEFTFADYRAGRWQESSRPGAPGSWVFHPFRSDVSRTIASVGAAPTSFCGELA